IKSLGYFVDQGIKIDARQARLIYAQMHLALSHLHAMNFLHRDVKPENILIAIDGNIKLADFGLITSMAEDGCTANNMSGTHDSFAPEVFTERRVSTSIDFWALVVSVMELYYGAHPFDHKSRAQVAKNINSNNPYFGQPQPKASLDELAFFKAFLQKNPKARPNPSSFVNFKFFTSSLRADSV
ncbi:AGC family protein kinase-like protein, partial [Dinothrombium tinctorium]